jgi:hypothetical protein
MSLKMQTEKPLLVGIGKSFGDNAKAAGFPPF